MVDIQSKEVIDKISDELKIQPALSIPRTLGKDIQLSYNVNPVRNIQVIRSPLIDASAVTMLTTSPTKRTFICGVQLSVSKSVLSTSVFSNISANPKNGAAVQLAELRYEPVTAGEHETQIQFTCPIELDTGTNVILNNSTAIASIDTIGIIYFYETDPQ